jgi:hypothetical protein
MPPSPAGWIITTARNRATSTCPVERNALKIVSMLLLT